MKISKIKSAIPAVLVIAGFSLVGCNSGSGTSYDAVDSQPDTVTTVYSGGGDIDYSQVSVGDGSTYIENGDGTVTYVTDAGDVTVSVTHEIKDVGSSNDAATLDAADTPAECSDLGGSWCSIEQKCLTRDQASAPCPGR